MSNLQPSEKPNEQKAIINTESILSLKINRDTLAELLKKIDTYDLEGVFNGAKMDEYNIPDYLDEKFEKVISMFIEEVNDTETIHIVLETLQEIPNIVSIVFNDAPSAIQEELSDTLTKDIRFILSIFQAEKIATESNTEDYEEFVKDMNVKEIDDNIQNAVKQIYDLFLDGQS